MLHIKLHLFVWLLATKDWIFFVMYEHWYYKYCKMDNE